MRTETKVGLLLNAVGITIGRLTILPDFVSGFSCGLSVSLGVFMLIVGLIPKKQYDSLLYRKWLTSRD
jgi:hypothetical protein